MKRRGYRSKTVKSNRSGNLSSSLSSSLYVRETKTVNNYRGHSTENGPFNLSFITLNLNKCLKLIGIIKVRCRVMVTHLVSMEFYPLLYMNNGGYHSKRSLLTFTSDYILKINDHLQLIGVVRIRSWSNGTHCIY